jgi:L-iditol 2-dehydrogenase
LLAAILKMPGVIVIDEAKLPVPSEGELVVRVRSALTCGTDLKAYIRGHTLIPMPGFFGHEFSGIVAEKGKGVSRFKVGDPVMSVHSAPCLNCQYCKMLLYNLCESLMLTKVLGAFSEYILIPAHVVRQNVFRKPDSLSFKEAAFLEPLSCVVHSIDPINLNKKSIILIIGAGPIGLLHLMIAKTQGAKVLITGLEAERLETAKKLGADAVFHPSQAKESVCDFTSGMGVDYVFECTGQPVVWESSVDYLRRGGTVILFGGCKKGTLVNFSAERLHYDEITLKGTFHFTPLDVRKAFSILKKKEIEVKELISGTYPLKEIEKAFTRLIKGQGIKYAILP